MPHSYNIKKTVIALTGRIIPGTPFSLRLQVGNLLLKIVALTVTSISWTKLGDESGLRIAPQITVQFRGAIAATKAGKGPRALQRPTAPYSILQHPKSFEPSTYSALRRAR